MFHLHFCYSCWYVVSLSWFSWFIDVFLPPTHTNSLNELSILLYNGWPCWLWLFTLKLIGWKVWWIVSLFIKHHLAPKFKWPGKALCNCRHWWTNLIQRPYKGFIWFLDCTSQVFPEECLFFRFAHKKLIPFSRTELPLKMFMFIVDKLWYWFELLFFKFFLRRNSVFLPLLLSSSDSFVSLLKLVLVPVEEHDGKLISSELIPHVNDSVAGEQPHNFTRSS